MSFYDSIMHLVRGRVSGCVGCGVWGEGMDGRGREEKEDTKKKIRGASNSAGDFSEKAGLGYPTETGDEGRGRIIEVAFCGLGMAWGCPLTVYLMDSYNSHSSPPPSLPSFPFLSLPFPFPASKQQPLPRSRHASRCFPLC